MGVPHQFGAILCVESLELRGCQPPLTRRFSIQPSFALRATEGTILRVLGVRYGWLAIRSSREARAKDGGPEQRQLEPDHPVVEAARGPSACRLSRPAS